MKKLIGTAMLAALLAALLATSAFAEITMGAWLRVLAAPVAGNGDDIVAGMTNSWGWGARVARADIRGTSEDEKAGFSMQIFNDVGGISAGDEAALWVKPWDFLKVSLGHYDYTAFRGDLCYGSWNWIRPQNWLQDDEGLTFDKLGAKNGLHLELTPVEGLMIMWNLPIGYWGEAYKMFEQQDIAAKYTIGDIGTIKLGWAGKGARVYKNKEDMHAAGYKFTNDKNEDVYYGSAADVAAALDAQLAKDAGDQDTALVNGLKAFYTTGATYEKAVAGSGEEKYFGDINVAFDLTAVENLYITVGARISIASSDYKKLGGNNFAMPGQEDPSLFNTFKGAIGASYQVMDNLKVSASYAVFTFYQPDGADIDPMHQFGVGVDVGLTDALSLAADFRAFIPCNEIDPSFSFLVGLQYACSSNGYVGIGFQGTTNGCGFLPNGGQSKLAASKADSFCWAVPIAVSVWF